MTLRRCLFGALMVLGLLSTLAWFSAPHFIRQEINKRPDVKVDAVRVYWGCLHLSGVHLTRANGTGSFPSVWYCTGKRVRVEGGEVDWALASDSAGNFSNSATGFQVEAEGIRAKVARPPLSAVLDDVTYRQGKVSFRTGLVRHPRGQVRVDNGEVSEDRRHLKLDKVYLEAPLEVRDYLVSGELRGVVLHIQEQSATVEGLQVSAGKKDGPTSTARFEGAGLRLQGEQLELTAKQCTLYHKSLSAKDLTFEDLVTTLDLKDPMRGSRTIRVKGVELQLDPENLWAKGAATCQEWVSAMPQQLREGTPLADLSFEGSLSFEVQTKPTVAMKASCSCKATCTPAIKTLLGKFTYHAHHPDGSEWTRATGQGTEDWVPLPEVSENMTLALLTTEDPGFFGHRGFLVEAFRNSLADNLKVGRVIRGGSTLTMQLAKNLWLPRARTYGRKVQEVFLTMALESCLTKEQILELYLNIVEFGPDIYGIGPAARKLLESDPMHLSLVEALYLTTRLPRPLKSGPFNPEKLEGAARLLDHMVKTGKISEDRKLFELDALAKPTGEEDVGGDSGWGL